MFMDTLLKKGLPRSRGAKCSLRLPNISLFGARKFVWVIVVYKHFVPLGPKTTATKNTDWFVRRTVDTEH
jgi:hypothetical protein